MSFAHLHLILNHIPLVGIPIALLFYVRGLNIKNNSMKRFSSFVLFALAAFVIPVFLSGDYAEDQVEMLPGVLEAAIELHDEAAEASLILCVLAGIAAFLDLWFQRNLRFKKWTSTLLILLSSIAIASLGYTASLGGKIRRPELRQDLPPPNTEWRKYEDSND
ncbi:hypothetical protein GW916_04630 [bacterium]|nr:hypothetical protein [bacterium]